MFSKDFIFGCATASFQIEGAHDKDGKVKSIWDTFCENKNNTADGSDGKNACRSYDKTQEDIELLSNLGVDSYRFSIAWTRIINEKFEVNPKGLKHYKDFALKLLEKGIKPCVTLYHWDLPQYLQDMGGFLNPEFPNWFKNYVDVVTKELADVVKDYITINEPQVILYMGHRSGVHAPGLKLGQKDMLFAIHNLLKAHGEACKVIRANVKDSTIGFAPCSRGNVPVDPSNKDLVKKCYDEYFELGDDEFYPNLVSVYSDPVFLGDYPKEYYERFKGIHPEITKEDLELIHQKVDYCYQNVYSGQYFDFDENGNLKMLPFKLGMPMGNVEWLQVVPESLYYVAKNLYERYKHPIIISENGDCCHDSVSLDGKVHDPNRVDFINRYLACLEKASKEVDVRGYYYWSLLDNFEWAEGYTKRFGIVYVDYETYERIPKDSYYEYQKIIKTRKLD